MINKLNVCLNIFFFNTNRKDLIMQTNFVLTGTSLQINLRYREIRMKFRELRYYYEKFKYGEDNFHNLMQFRVRISC